MMSKYKKNKTVKRYKKVYYVISLFVIGIYCFYVSMNMLILALMWNLILALIPLFISNIMKSKPFNPITFIIWILFIPNAFYIVTDAIHIQGLETFYTIYKSSSVYGESNVVYNVNYTLWLQLFVIEFYIFNSILIGCTSVQQVLNIFSEKMYYYLSLFFSILISLGIYIGRFLRFNSWDIVNVKKILDNLYNVFNYDAIMFIIIVSVFIFLCNLIYCELNRNKLNI